WENILSQVDESWQELVERSQARPALGENDALLARTAQLVSGADPQGDPTLVRDLAASLAWQPQAAPLHNALGLAIACSAQQQGPPPPGVADQPVDSSRRPGAAAPAHVAAGLTRAEALVGIEQKNEAPAAAKRTLAILDRVAPSPAILDGGHFPPAWDHFRVE